jgi:hypothetical protein
MKITRRQLRRLVKEAAVTLDPQGMQSMGAQRSFLADNFEDEEYFTVEFMTKKLKDHPAGYDILTAFKNETGTIEGLRGKLILKIIAAELDDGHEGLIDYVLGVDV